MQLLQRFKSILLALFVAGSIFSCAGINKTATRTKVDVGEFISRKFKQYQKYGAVILYDEGILEVKENAGLPISTLKRRRVIKIFDKSKFYLANVSIPYSSSTLVTDISASTILPDGSSVQLDKGDIFDVTLYPQFIFYSDVRAKKFALPAVEEGCIIDYQWTKIIQNYSNWDRWQFQNDLPTLESRFQITIPKKLSLNWRPVGHNMQPTIKSDNAAGHVTYNWRMESLLPFKQEPAMPAGASHIIGIRFSPFGLTTWQKVHDWYADLIKGRNSATPLVSELADSIVANAATDIDKLERLYTFVRDKVRYVAISIGIGGYQPHHCEWVAQKRYGDCKDKVTLLSALAASQSIKLNYVLISTAQNGRVDTTVASHSQFNHVIARAHLSDGTTIWMDPTEQFCPFGELPWYDKDRLVLEIGGPDSSQLIKTPGNSYLKNGIFKFWDIEIDSAATLRARGKIKYKGDSALLLRKELFGFPEDQIEDHLKRQLFYDVPFANIEMIQVSNLFNPQANIEIYYELNTELPELETNDIHLNLGQLFTTPLFAAFVDSRRNYPVVLPFPFQTVDSIRVTHANMKTVAAPETQFFNSPHLRCIFTGSVSDSLDTFSRTVQVLDNEFSASDYGKFLSTQRSIYAHNSKPYLLKCKK